jgi:hypothetical protein
MIGALFAFAAGLTMASLYHTTRALIAARRQLRLQLRRELAREFRWRVVQHKWEL